VKNNERLWEETCCKPKRREFGGKSGESYRLKEE